MIRYASGVIPCPLPGAPDALSVRVFREYPATEEQPAGWCSVAAYLADDEDSARAAAAIMIDAVARTLDPPGEPRESAWYGQVVDEWHPTPRLPRTHVLHPEQVGITRQVHGCAWRAVEAFRMVGEQ